MRDERQYELIARQIAQLIDDGVFPVGSRLPGERRLAERLNVSRLTVREAGIALQATGRVEVKTGSGVYVADVSKRYNCAMPQVSGVELTQARLLFESAVAAFAAPQMDDVTLARLDRLVEIMKTGSNQEAENADQDFHMTIAQASQNSVICFVVQALWSCRNGLQNVKALHDAVCSEEAPQRADEHAAILDALRARDAAATRDAMRRHFSRLIGAMLDVTEALEADEIRKSTSRSRQRFLRSL